MFDFKALEKELGRKLPRQDRLKLQKAEEQNWECARDGCTLGPLPQNPRQIDLAHKISKSAVTREEAAPGDVYLYKDGELTDNACILHSRCNQTQGDGTIWEAAGRAVKFPNWSPMRLLVDARTQAQKARIQWNNRAIAAERLDQPEIRPIAMKFRDYYREIEDVATQEMLSRVEALALEDTLILAMKMVLGIGWVLACRILADIKFEEAEHPSSLQRFAGYGVVDGQREKQVKGETRSYNKTLKIAIRNAVEQFIKLGRGLYEKKYRDRRHTTEHHAEWKGRKNGHKHNDAIGIAGKLFLSHLWEVGRGLEGLPVTGPFVVDRLQHVHGYISPQDAGWPSEEDLNAEIEKLRKRVEKREKRRSNGK